jgi:glycerol-3-phosphate O-acyltransferase / dihydroxyacetone phosphate acyltransferase
LSLAILNANIHGRLVDLFSTTDAAPNFIAVKRHLLSYYSLLQATGLTNDVLSGLPLDSALDPSKHTPLGLRLRTLALLVKDSLSALVRLPFFAFPLIVHAPVYVMSRLGGKLVEDEEETQAQNKVVLGLLSMFAIYPITFFVLWALLWFSPIGALLAGSTVYLFAVYHNRLINGKWFKHQALTKC